MLGEASSNSNALANLAQLKLTGCPAGLLLNFNVTSLRTGVKRLVRPDLYVKK
jgi:hypothetical protein